MSLATTAAAGAATTLLGQWGRFVLNFAGIAVLARILSPDDFGLVAMVGAVSGIGMLLADFGLSMATIQSKAITPRQTSMIFWINLALGVVLAAVIVAAAPLLASFYGRDEVADIARALGLVFVLGAASSQFRAQASRSFKFRGMAVVDVAAQATALAVGISVAVMGYGYWAIVCQQIGLAAAQLVGLAVVARWWPGLPRRSEPIGSLVRFGTSNLGVQLMNYLANNIDTILVGKFLGGGATGIYSRAYQLFRLPLQQLAAPMTRVAFPILSRIEGTPAYDRFLGRAQLILTYVLGAVFFAAAILANPIIEIVLGPGWEEAKIIFLILALGGVFQSLGYVYYWVFLSKALMGLQLRFTFLTRSLMIGLVALGLLGGVEGVAVGASAGLLVNWGILTIFAMPRTGVDVRGLLRVAARPLAVYIAMALLLAPLVVVSWTWTPWVSLPVLTAAMVVFLAATWLCSRLVRHDVGLVVDAARRIRRPGGLRGVDL